MQHKEAETIFDLDEKKKIILNKETLYKILLQDHVRDKNVCVISIAGAFRQGKSFFLNFLIRYLNMKYKQKKDVKKWLDGQNESISGFSWQGGSKRHTVGILMWPEIFLAELPSGEEIAIILLDTQGSFDVVSTVTECATIFALSTLISSVQIYNLKENIKQCDLAHLEYFVNYGQMVLDNSEYGGPPFQNLLFLIRDWQWPDDNKFGFKGGEKLLDHVLNTDSEDVVESEILEQRKNVKKMFENISCFLLPHPGKAVATDKKFKGELHKIEPEFNKNMEILAPHILDVDNLVLKTVNGRRITVGELANVIETYWECFESGQMPQLSTLLLTSSKLLHVLGMNEAENIYDESMNIKMGGVEEVFSDEDLKNIHDESKNIAVNHYSKTKKMGDQVIDEQYKTQLEEKLELKFLDYQQMNQLNRENQGIVSWIKYMFSKKWVTGPVYGIVSSATASITGYVGFTSAVATAGVLTVETVGATALYAAVGFMGGAAIIAPASVIGLAVIGWKWWSKKSSRKNLNEDEKTGSDKELIPLIEHPDRS